MAVWSESTVHEMQHRFRRLDAEFARPDYAEAEAKVCAASHRALGELGAFVPGPFGSAFHVRDYVTSSEYRYIRGQDVNGFVVKDEEPRFVSEDAYRRLSKYAVQESDVMISVVGTLGQVAVCTEHEVPAVFSCKSTILRAREVNPFYLATYLNSIFGQQCLLRRQRGAIQMGLNIEDLRSIPVPRFESSEEETISGWVAEALALKHKGKRLYADAQQILESELGLDKLHFDKPVGYTAQFSELESSRRNDAQHYQPRFAQLLNHLAKFPNARIRDVRRHNRRGIQPIYVADGTHAVVNSQHLGPKHIDYDGLQRTTEQAFDAAPEAHIEPEDLLIYTTGAYIGRTNVYLDDAPAFASNHVNILRLSPDIDHAYMGMVFQSIVGQFQTQKHARGSAQAELYPADIDKFVVPLLKPAKQEEIGNLVRDSLKKQRESAQLLERAKARVEQLIEEAIAK